MCGMTHQRKRSHLCRRDVARVYDAWKEGYLDRVADEMGLNADQARSVVALGLLRSIRTAVWWLTVPVFASLVAVVIWLLVLPES